MTHREALNNRESIIKKKKPSSRAKKAAREVLLLSTAANISTSAREQISRISVGEVDWEYLLRLADFHGVAPLIARNLLDNDMVKSIPPPYPDRLKSAYDNSLYRNVIMTDELTRVLVLLRSHDIPAIALKGVILAEQLYGNPGLRAVSDMDILVNAEKLPVVNSLLQELGYEQVIDKKTVDHPFHEAPFRKQGRFPLFIEVHWNIADPRLVAVPQEEIWHRARLSRVQGGTVLVLSPEDTLIFLAISLAKPDAHVLMFLCDITELLNKYAGVMDWDYIVNSAKSWRIASTVYMSLNLARHLLGAQVPDPAIKTLEPGVFRLAVLNFLVNRENWISPIIGEKLRNETIVIHRSILMDHFHQTWEVLSQYRGTKWWGWLSGVIWGLVVFAAAAGHHASRFILKEVKR